MSAFSDHEKRVAKVIVDGLKAGLTEARSLERAGLLHTPALKASIASTAILDVARLLEETPVHQIITPGTPYSANDIKQCIVGWIENIVKGNSEE